MTLEISVKPQQAKIMNWDGDIFEQQVRDCLLNLYDYMFLQEHPLVRAVVPEAKGDASRVQVFRQAVTDAIESLNPGNGVDPNSRKTRIYHILQLRYISQQQIQYILHRLGVSERQFYRDHAKAVETLSRVLSERVQESMPVPAAPINTSISLQSEVQRVHTENGTHQVSGLAFVKKAIVPLQGVVSRRDAQIELDVADTLFALNTDHTVLRQAIIWVMSQLLAQSPDHSEFNISMLLSKSACQFIFNRRETVGCAPLYFPEDQKETLFTLVNALDGYISDVLVEGGESRIVLEIPIKQCSILIIDDNPDAVSLFRRYLVDQPYQVLTAQDGEQAIELATQAQPGLIVLDVMLPKQDGWEILQLLKNHRATRHIPVLICSVLNAADLALSVGADGFLRKPPGEREFLETIADYLTPEV
jgi:CheY-like chemotaxis protein